MSAATLTLVAPATGAYLGKPAAAIAATAALLRHFRAFLASNSTAMRDPFELKLWGTAASTLDKVQAQRKLTWLINVAINRKAGQLDHPLNHRGTPARKYGSDYLRALGYDARALNTPRLRIYSITTPELSARFAHRLAVA